MMRVLDLFSGIGGFSLGLERAGMRTVAFCEIDPFCRRVLAKHWPEVPIYDDVLTLTGERLEADGIVADVICGGFPCQDISLAGKGAGIDGERSRLWFEFSRLVGELRPRYAIVENTSALLGRGMGVVLGDLAEVGFDAEWHCIPASAVGAPHIRDRVWIVAYAVGDELRHDEQRVPGRRPQGVRDQGHAVAGDNGAPRPVADPDADGGGREVLGLAQHAEQFGAPGHLADGLGAPGRRNGAHLADAAEPGPQARRGLQASEPASSWDRRSGDGSGARDIRLAGSARLPIGPRTIAERAHAATTGAGWWATEPDVGRVVDGPAARLHRRQRILALGNALVPDIPELLGRAILAMEARA